MVEIPAQKNQEWYLADTKTMEATGPFKTEVLLARIKEGSLRIDAFVWGPHLPDAWMRILDVEEFKAALIAYPKTAVPKRSRGISAQAAIPPRISFSEKKGDYGVGNLYRRYPRAPLITDVIVHNQKIYRRGRSVDISEKGLFLKMEDTEAFQKGEEVTIVVRSEGELGTFATVAVVIRVLNEGDFVGYGLFFLRLNPMFRRRIVKYVLAEFSESDNGQPREARNPADRTKEPPAA